MNGAEGVISPRRNVSNFFCTAQLPMIRAALLSTMAAGTVLQTPLVSQSPFDTGEGNGSITIPRGGFTGRLFERRVPHRLPPRVDGSRESDLPQRPERPGEDLVSFPVTGWNSRRARVATPPPFPIRQSGRRRGGSAIHRHQRSFHTFAKPSILRHGRGSSGENRTSGSSTEAHLDAVSKRLSAACAD